MFARKQKAPPVRVGYVSFWFSRDTILLPLYRQKRPFSIENGRFVFTLPHLVHIDAYQYKVHLCYNGGMSYWITTTQPRLDTWHRALGLTALPVTTARPMMIWRAGRKRPFWMIDAEALTLTQRMRLIGWVWKSRWVDWKTAVSMVDEGVLIDAHNCELVEPMNAHSSALLFPSLLYAA